MSELHVKTVRAAVKSVDAEQGLVTSVRAVFGNVDFQNDRILPGAFTRTIAAWRAKMAVGGFVPVVYGHRDDPDFVIGKVLDLEQTDEGLQTTERYFLGKPKARAAFDLIREGVLPGGSFGYGVRKSKRAADGANDLIELDLIEVGPTLYPANDATRLVGVKADEARSIDLDDPLAVAAYLGADTDRLVAHAFATRLDEFIGAKVGRRLSARTVQQLRDVMESLRTVLDEEDKAQAEQVDGKSEVQPDEAKALDDPPLKAAARALLAAAPAALDDGKTNAA